MSDALPGCHVDEGDLFSRQLIDENRDPTAVGMTVIKNTETFAVIDSE
jgi:hypothetical protein